MVGLLNWGGSFLHSLLAFIIILVPLVVFHEFGHYVFARIFGVKAEVFSVGFGPKIWSRQMGETELRLSMIPMGGYVKLLGEDRDAELSPEEQKRALHRQAPWKRFFIFFGGPFFNFILAIFIFMVILFVGEPQMASVAGRIVHGSPAAKIGLQSGDRILSVDGKPVKRFEEVMIAINENPQKTLDFELIHSGAKSSIHLPVPVSSRTGFSMYGETKNVGELDGLLPIARANSIGVSDSKSWAAQNGLQTGDLLTEINHQAIPSWEEIENVYQAIPVGQPIHLKFENLKSHVSKEFDLKKPVASNGLSRDFGIYSSEMFVEKVVSKSPAEGAGLKQGDRLVGIGHVNVESFFELKEAVQKAGETEGKVQLRWERNGSLFSKDVVPTATNTRDPILNKTTLYTVGIMPALTLAEPATFVEKVWNPFKLVYLATDRMITFTWRNLVSLRKMVSGDVSVGTLGGPIMIGKIAGESLTRGLISFLTNMAVFSIGLGVLNILPVPVLDGGHLLLLGIEAIRKKPLTLKQMEIIQGVGLMLILALMGIAFHNDISRLIYS